MWVQHGAAVFGMKLCADIPGVCGDFYYFYKFALGVYAAASHTGFFVCLAICVVEFIAMSMTLAYFIGAVYAACFAAFDEYAVVASESHRTSFVGDGLLVFHDVDDVMLCGGANLYGIGIAVA